MSLPCLGLVRRHNVAVHVSPLAKGCPKWAHGEAEPSPEEHVSHHFLGGLDYAENRSEDTQRCQNLQLILISKAPLFSPQAAEQQSSVDNHVGKHVNVVVIRLTIHWSYLHKGRQGGSFHLPREPSSSRCFPSDSFTRCHW